MISIITRCYNRLEYTIQVVNAVRLAGGDYEHIIIDNASTDGTLEWFSWIHSHCPWYNKLRYIGFNLNLGDWGGMVKGLNYASGEYIAQLDNDIIPCQTWLKDMQYVLDNTDHKVVMLKRENVAWKLKPLSPAELLMDGSDSGLKIARVERAVACYMTKRPVFEKIVKGVKDAKKSKYEMRAIVDKDIVKIMNRTCIELEADFQRTKYNPKNSQVWHKL